MKKLLFNIILLCIYAANLEGQDIPDDFDILKGNISSVLEKDFKNPLHPGDEKGQLHFIYEFTDGKVVRKTLYYGEHLDEIERYEYNKHDLVDKEITEFSLLPDGVNFAIKHSYTFDSLSRIKQELTYYPDGKPLYKKDSIKYDQAGNLIAYLYTIFPYHLDVDPDTTKRMHLFKYDTLKRMVNHITIHFMQPDMKLTEEANYSYDKSGNIISEESFQGLISFLKGEKINVQYSYLFDKRGNWIKKYLH